ncbi:biotin--[acetyl-CoA-carboxylase] ligase [Gordonia desulfuricans]|uniref:biotin--[biotin carboxyl-carrier protein] ligase n=1 Tax=Gordonia desulfuricans TaxID=89051 RepID=A0A7K3LTC7_9ACTN|nr:MULTISPECIES: biotin--[acetyl-CoA-carboxylase] ligase [Gordonia]KOY49284.1 biotin--acetyl-CoA-carboxylase ligase [Gordonia sp. NB41Y]NDK91489.1 biotin--[acetyl-CoA-carboxylase] ligase [Gordonia desulfuricans]WLP91491.1 biotin--[acetyl-CoA-carboxylase] ligase [Gordonia sp. NB41Y]
MTDLTSGDPSDLRSGIDRLGDRLAGTIWQRVEVVDSTGSTNADLVARASEPDIVGTARITTDQTAGRGRHSRVWEAPAGAQLAISAVLPVRGHTDTLGWLSLATGLAVATAIEETTGLRAMLKWPNDVLIGDKKVSGILAEYVAATDSVPGGIAVVGTGFNTDMTADQLPVPTATSLRIELGEPVDAAALAVDYLRALGGLGWPDDLATITRRYRDRCDTLGRRVRLILPGDDVRVGTAVDVDPDGRIVVRTDSGEQVSATAADVVHLRPEDD